MRRGISQRTRDAVVAAHDGGEPLAVAAERSGVDYSALCAAWKRLYPGERPARRPRADRTSPRQQEAADLRSDGLTFTAIGLVMGVSRQRAEQMVKEFRRGSR